MKHLTRIIAAGLAALALAACQPNDPDPKPQPGTLDVIRLNAVTISTPTSWTRDHVYVVENEVTVASTLTIDPGTVVMFAPSAAIVVSATGRLLADGTASARIVFTSLEDDAPAGDVNGDGASTGTRGDWRLIDVSGSNSSFRFCDVRYGGATMIWVRAAGVSVRDCVFAHGAMSGATDDEAALFLDEVATVTGNRFYDGGRPLRMLARQSLDDSNLFRSADGASTNERNGVFVPGGIVTGATTWAELDVPFVLTQATTVEGTLTLAPGAVVKVYPTLDLAVASTGRLLATGTAAQPIVFTSLKDDVLSDTNAGPSAPAPGDWRMLDVMGANSTFAHCRFRYGGETMLWIRAAGVSVTDSEFAHGAPGLDGAALWADAVATITGNRFYDDGRPLFILASQSLDDSNRFEDEGGTVGSVQNGVFFDGRTTGAVTWTETEVPFVARDGAAIDGSLTLGPDVAVKLLPGALVTIEAAGSFSPSASSVLTAWTDDAVKGDSNGDGASSGSAGFWEGVWDNGAQAWVTPASARFAAH